MKSVDESLVVPEQGSPSCVADVDSKIIGDELVRSELFIERELSWLDFNERVLELAEDPHIPILERTRFLAIFASNLDEFFMVRVAGLQRRIDNDIATASVAGWEPGDLLDEVRRRGAALTERHAEVFSEQVAPELAEHGIHIVDWDSLTEQVHIWLHDYFRREVYPILTPQAVDPAHPFPYVTGLSLNLAVQLRDPVSGDEIFARVEVPQTLPRFIKLPKVGLQDRKNARNIQFLPVEDLVAVHLEELFDGSEVLDYYPFRVTRNADLEVEEDDAENLLNALEKELQQRRFGGSVRLELAADTSPSVAAELITQLEVDSAAVFAVRTPLDLTGLNVVADVEASRLHYPRVMPTTHRALTDAESAAPEDMFSAIRSKDIVLHHPYHSFSTSVQEFVRQAAQDPNVLAIKQTLYRTSGNSPIISALIEAAKAGKQVLAVVEIKARFDEQANISWARTLERHGVHVVYGVIGLKTHAKLCLVVRRERDGLRQYCHIGTGNYNPKTARVYEDTGLLTCDPAIADDVARLFHRISGFAPQTQFHRLLVAPKSLRSGLVDLIRQEVANHKAGLPAWIKFKMNSLVDEQMIDELYAASMSGVGVDIIVRGMCALRPGIPGVSDTIRVRSILGRYLEHSRIYAFCNGGSPRAYIGSADLMHRNLDRRIEAVVRLPSQALADEQVNILDMSMSDSTSSWWLDSAGNWTRHCEDAQGTRLDDLHEVLNAKYSKGSRTT